MADDNKDSGMKLINRLFVNEPETGNKGEFIDEPNKFEVTGAIHCGNGHIINDPYILRRVQDEYVEMPEAKDPKDTSIDYDFKLLNINPNKGASFLGVKLPKIDIIIDEVEFKDGGGVPSPMDVACDNAKNDKDRQKR